MTLLRLITAASAVSLAVGTATLSIAGLRGSRNGWLDVINNFAPLLSVMGLLGAGLAYLSLTGLDRAVTIALALIAVGYGAALLTPEIVSGLRSRSQAGFPFKLLSVNVWRDNPSPDQAIAKILARGPDAILLQEADGALADVLDKLQSHYPYRSDCPGSGVVIFVKRPISASGCGFDRGAQELDWAWVRTTAGDGGAVTLATTHFAWPLPPGPQSAQRRLLAAGLSQLQPGDLILTGDFNTTPWSFGMRNQDKLLAPLTRRTWAWFSWPARLDVLSQPWPIPILPIDHIYAGVDWTTRRLTLLRIPGSDHFGTEAVFSRR
jgi:endonuclease/exonuclease/phosphatase (EEP) superfamily protein YafD